MKNISLANNPFVKIPSAKPSVSRNKKVICSQKSVVNNTPLIVASSTSLGHSNYTIP